ncbi:hypothetical protein STCU_08614 [Strigomonas culicis]|uniref:Activator of Hsp90 ATPase homologue 1/2-like C-terminal domain-containing protein n=1 Tax=Strigomonas culicis TaxID=28005 RepID=S9V2Z7_9TRYP|nr:hypothetical protein STCU_08614 [Strigomonas culicis]|eukprot:EPY21286.1 hypothetical protein STCU_08614 [Strigomonas culicis]
MAAVGEGDPRWIVSERKDGANVNSWHWGGARPLQAHARGAEEALRGPAHRGRVGGRPVLPRDRGAQRGKGRRHCGAAQGEDDVLLRAAPDAQVEGRGGGVGRGGVRQAGGAGGRPRRVPQQVQHHRHVQENSAAAQKVEAVVRERGREAVRATIVKFFEKIFQEYHIGETLKSGTAMPPPPIENTVAAPSSAAAKKDAAADRVDVTSVQWRMRWGAPIEALFEALVSQQKACMYTRAPAKIDAKVGGQFEFLGGVISGYYVDFQAPTLLKQQWRLKSWPVGVHSTVTLELVKEEPSVTTLKFSQVGIPAGELQSVKEGWKANFFDAIKMIFQCSMEYL